MQTRKSHALLGSSLMAIVLVGAGCFGSGAVQTNVNAAMNTNAGVTTNESMNDGGSQGPTGMTPAQKLLAQLDSQNSSGQTGTVDVTPTEDGTKTHVIISLVGEPTGSKEPAHIHMGACPAPGAVKWGLNDVINGKSDTTLDTPIADLFAAGALAVNVHKSGAETGIYMACGDLHMVSDAVMGDGEEDQPGDENGAMLNVNASLNATLGTVAKPREIKVTAKQFEFEPNEIHVKVGETIKLTMTNEDVAHSIAVPALGINLKADAKQTASTNFTADKKGEFPFFCSTMCGSGHRSMTGKIVVE